MLTSNQQELYNDLMALTANEAFYHIDQTLEDVEYRIFNYRLASYTEFCLPNSLEARGIMFRMENGQPTELVCRPMTKFFNLFENPYTMNLDLSQTITIMEKADGSLISTYLHNGMVKVKSKASLQSDQARAAQKILDKDDQLLYAVTHYVKRGYTVNMEYTSPSNRIVVSYEKPQLTILNIRNNETGQYIHQNTLRAMSRAEMNNLVLRYWINTLSISDVLAKYESVSNFVERIKDEEGIEGYVIVLKDGTQAKIKNNWYLARHKAKDGVNSTRKLFEAVLDEAVDDLRSMFHDDPIVLARITDVQERADKIYNHLAASIDSFYNDNKELDRKSYAILGQQTFTDGTFGLAMNKYLGKDAGYVDFLKKQYKRYGFSDDIQTTE